jgi:alkylhydroperoxidase family enzyme
MPRLPLVPSDQLTPDDRAALATLTERQVPGADAPIFATLAHVPPVMHTALAHLDALMAPGAVSADLKRLIAARVTLINPCVFCVQRVLAQRFNIPQDLSAALIGLDAHRDRFSDAEYTAIRYAEMVTTSPTDVDARLWSEVQDHFSDAAIVELTALIGFINYLNSFADALGIS